MYIVVEIQTAANGAVSTLTWSYASRNDAEAQYHTVLSAAAVSALPKHAAIMFSEEGFPLRNECYKHETAAVEQGEGE